MHHITFLNFKPHLYENSIEEIIHGKTRVFNNHTFGVSHILKGYKLNGYILEKNGGQYTHEVISGRPCNNQTNVQALIVIPKMKTVQCSKVFYFGYVRDNNYQMFFTTLFPKLCILHKLLQTRWKNDKNITIIISGKACPPNKKSSYIEENIRIFISSYFGQTFKILQNEFIFECSELFLPGWLSNNYSICYPDLYTHHIFQQLRENALTFKSNINFQPKYIYISRKDPNKDSTRHLIDPENKLTNYLKEKGFYVGTGSSLSTYDKAHLFKKCELLLVEVGASVTNIVFLNPILKPKVICICNKNKIFIEKVKESFIFPKKYSRELWFSYWIEQVFPGINFSLYKEVEDITPNQNISNYRLKNTDSFIQKIKKYFIT